MGVMLVLIHLYEILLGESFSHNWYDTYQTDGITEQLRESTLSFHFFLNVKPCVYNLLMRVEERHDRWLKANHERLLRICDYFMVWANKPLLYNKMGMQHYFLNNELIVFDCMNPFQVKLAVVFNIFKSVLKRFIEVALQQKRSAHVVLQS